MNLVISGLYVGSLQDAKNEVQLNRYKVTHVVSVILFAKPIFLNRHYLCVRISDAHDQNIAQYFPVCNEFIHRARVENTESSNVLIHCYQGYSRSIAIAMAYLMSIANLNFEDAYRLLRLVRLGARPNIMFQMQLRNFEQTDLPSEHVKLCKFYGSPESQILDRRRCQSIINNTDNIRSEHLRFIDEGEFLGLHSISGTEHSSIDVQQSSNENIEFEESDDSTPVEGTEESNESRTIHRLSKYELKKLLRAMQVLRELRSQHGPTDEEIASAFEQEVLVGNAVLYRPLLTRQINQ